MDRRIAIIVLVCLALASALVVYPIVHEGGHYIAGKALGAEVREVVWTMFGGRPHVLFGQTPAHLIPWINAAGILLPTIVGGVAALLWLKFSERWPYWWRAGILIPTIVLLAGNLGPLAELFEPPDLLNHHMYPLAHYLGLRSALSYLFQLIPAILSIILLVLCFRRTRKSKPHSSS